MRHLLAALTYVAKSSAVQEAMLATDVVRTGDRVWVGHNRGIVRCRN
jgi:ligand-binding sensor domain-containing protein